MSRAILMNLAKLVDGRAAGGYDLPDDVLAARTAGERLGRGDGFILPEPDGFYAEGAAAELADGLISGDDTNLAGLAARVHEAKQQRAVVEEARIIAAMAAEKVNDRTSTLMASLCDQVVADHSPPPTPSC